MTQFTYMAIKVADEDQFNQVAEKLRGMGYEADKNPAWGAWHKDANDWSAHVLAYRHGRFELHSHCGVSCDTRYTYEQFMQL
jgi:hypothetical protein